jgi:dTDP-4-amino-4,6-dideoxygalactose transaminase
MTAVAVKKLKSLAGIPVAPAIALCRRLAGGKLTYPEFGSQTVDMDDLILARSLLDSPDIWDDVGPIRRFERQFAAWNGSLGAYTFMGGRVALSAAIAALRLQPGDEVIVPGYTCIVVANALIFSGVTVRYCDIELGTYGPDFDSFQQLVTPKTRAVVVQHTYGLVARDMEKIIEFARSAGLYVIEDCAHAMGASLRGIHVGNFGDIGFYSMEQSKVLSTFNGGVAVSNNHQLLERIGDYQSQAPYPSKDRIRRLLINFILAYRLQKSPMRWMTSGYLRNKHGGDILHSTTETEINGKMPAEYGQRMPAPLAILAENQLGKIDDYNKKRKDAALYWMKRCVEKGFTVPLILQDSRPVFLRFPIMAPSGRKYDLRWCKREFGVKQGFWFTGELHPVARQMDTCPNARNAVLSCINLPTLGFEP